MRLFGVSRFLGNFVGRKLLRSRRIFFFQNFRFFRFSLFAFCFHFSLITFKFSLFAFRFSLLTFDFQFSILVNNNKKFCACSFLFFFLSFFLCYSLLFWYARDWSRSYRTRTPVMVIREQKSSDKRERRGKEERKIGRREWRGYIEDGTWAGNRAIEGCLSTFKQSRSTLIFYDGFDSLQWCQNNVLGILQYNIEWLSITFCK